MSDPDRAKLVDDLIKQDKGATVKDFLYAVTDIDEEEEQIRKKTAWIENWGTNIIQ